VWRLLLCVLGAGSVGFDLHSFNGCGLYMFTLSFDGRAREQISLSRGERETTIR